ncbi:cation diffusion facilitator family transporter [Microlunatus flavus]|uniref:Cation diffusion facilitator family transporter n=1 Tax=Microlunatus flavus TaxID=1036181 RepID=A0A1H9DE32_9ACTN|nr:cation diffusion facilitator family transporter [Microlunatus flavus]SEQ11557.1 cation diffusion facilitator family transporter [Microlunatus flavus]
MPPAEPTTDPGDLTSLTPASSRPTKGKDGKESKGGESLFTVILAFTANLVIAVAKTIAAMLTGSASMLAEAAHSWADTGNEIFLLIAERRSGRRRDEEHPLGYGREAYVWSMIAAFGLFTAGAVVSISHGISELRDPEPGGDYLIAYIVLAISFVLEGTSFLQALRQSRKDAKAFGRTTLGFVLNTSNPTLRAVFAEDSAALVGLLIAGAGIVLHQVTGSPVYDALGSIGVGLLLGVVAVILIDRNRRFLVGEAVPADARARVLAFILAQPEVERVTYLHLEFVGPSRLYLVAAVDITGEATETTVAHRLREVERELEVEDVVEEAVLTLSTPEEPALTL